jgi:hypothetical protein
LNDAYALTTPNLSQGYVPDGLNRYASVDGVTYMYDVRGNLTSRPPQSYGYEFRGHST